MKFEGEGEDEERMKKIQKEDEEEPHHIEGKTMAPFSHYL